MSRTLLEPHCFRNFQNGPKSDTKLEKYSTRIGNWRWTVLILFFLNKCVVFNVSLEIISGESPPTVWVNAPTRIYCGFCTELDKRFLTSLALCPHVCVDTYACMCALVEQDRKALFWTSISVVENGSEEGETVPKLKCFPFYPIPLPWQKWTLWSNYRIP